MDPRDQYDFYRGKSQAELMDVLEQLTAEQKSAGEMSNTHMEEIYAMLAPMLSESQKARMREVIARLKSPNDG